jgi:hypothetical protein
MATYSLRTRKNRITVCFIVTGCVILMLLVSAIVEWRQLSGSEFEVLAPHLNDQLLFLKHGDDFDFAKEPAPQCVAILRVPIHRDEQVVLELCRWSDHAWETIQTTYLARPSVNSRPNDPTWMEMEILVGIGEVKLDVNRRSSSVVGLGGIRNGREFTTETLNVVFNDRWSKTLSGKYSRREMNPQLIWISAPRQVSLNDSVPIASDVPPESIFGVRCAFSL